MWMPYSNERLVVVLAICTNMMNIWASVVSLIFFDKVELHCSDQVMRLFSYRQHVLIDIDTSDVLHAINNWGKNVDYNWLSHYEAYIS